MELPDGCVWGAAGGIPGRCLTSDLLKQDRQHFATLPEAPPFVKMKIFFKIR
jgi:hypothetical protein